MTPEERARNVSKNYGLAREVVRGDLEQEIADAIRAAALEERLEEREACSKIADTMECAGTKGSRPGLVKFSEIAAAIRARSKELPQMPSDDAKSGFKPLGDGELLRGLREMFPVHEILVGCSPPIGPWLMSDVSDPFNLDYDPQPDIVIGE